MRFVKGVRGKANQEEEMRIPIYAPLIAVAVVIGVGIYAESLHQKKEAAVATAAPATLAKPVDIKKPVETANRKALNPRSKMKPVKPEPQMARAATLPEGRLVKLTGVVNSTSAKSIVVERNGKPVTVRLNGQSEWYAADAADVAAIGKTVTVYGRVRDAKSSHPVVDADAVYVPQSKRLLYSNGQNQTPLTAGTVTRVRFTANYQSM
jgi:hypothetical protein